jgi:hypothetical protein
VSQSRGPRSQSEGRPPKRNAEKDEETQIARALTLVTIDAKLKELSALKEYASERESLALDAEGRSFSLPPEEVSDKLLRYEAHYDRQLYRAMDQLERLQQRRGENVPPPRNLNLGNN